MLCRYLPLALVLAATACAEGPYVWVDDLPSTSLAITPYQVKPGDRLVVNVWNQAPLSGEVLVRPDGNVTLPLVGDVAVAGHTPPQVADAVAKRLGGLVVDPHVAVSLANMKEPTISVVGEVRQPGAYPLHAGEGVLEAIAKGGGLTEFADRGKVFVLRRSDALRVRLDYDKLSHADGAAVKLLVRDGDVIVVE